MSRRRFLSLLAAGAAVSGCSGHSGRVAAAAVQSPRRGSTAHFLAATTSNGVRPQVATPLPRIADPRRTAGLSLVGLPAGSPDHLLVLSYHNVTADGRQPGRFRRDDYTVTAADFAAQMQMLTVAGFRSVRMTQVLSAHSGGPALPPRSVLITFDDGGDGQWIYADRILAEVGYSAAAFLITGHLGTSPAYLSWPEAEALATTGRWDVEAHTHNQHHFVPTGPASRPASVLINRVWDPVSHSLESAQSARTRVENDLSVSLDLLGSKGFSKPTAFAYPFSQLDGPTNDPTLPVHVAGLLHAAFPLLLTNASPGRMAQPEDLRNGLLPRLEVRHDMTALNLYERILAADLPAGAEHSTDERSGG